MKLTLVSVILVLTACHRGGGGNLFGGGDGDRLFLGTTAGTNASGTVTVVVHAGDGGAAPAAEGKVVASSPGGACRGAVTAPNFVCNNSSHIKCGGFCCPPTHPFSCPSSNLCYVSASDAASACGTSTCETCSGQSTPVPGATVTQIVTGTVQTDGSLHLSGGNWRMDGDIAGDQIEGSYTDPMGNDGVFSANDATDSPVSRFCGTYAGGDKGTWNLQVASAKAAGAFAGGLASGTLSGTASGSSIMLTFHDVFASGSANGTVSGGTVSGTWRTTDNAYSGTWMGGTAACMGGASQVKSADDCCTMTSRGLSCPIEGC